LVHASLWPASAAYRVRRDSFRAPTAVNREACAREAQPAEAEHMITHVDAGTPATLILASSRHASSQELPSPSN
jgi:hypothetical protein